MEAGNERKETRGTTKKRIFKDRERTNFLKASEQKTITYLVSRVPAFLTPNRLTAIGFFGGLFVLLGFVLAHFYDRAFLLLGVFGLAVNWFGDSLDGRIAYYRNIPRKWYGFSLDIIMDWINTVLMGAGFLIYLQDRFELLSYFFVALYGWAMIISQLRYKITDEYTIDAGSMGPTEVRLIISTLLILEILIPGSLNYFAGLLVIVLLVVDIVDTRKLLDLGDERDGRERLEKLEKAKLEETREDHLNV